MMSYVIEIDKKLKTINYTHSGSISTEDIGLAWQELLELKEFTELKYNLLTDYRNAEPNIPTKTIKHICKFLLRLELILKGKKQAIIVNEPLGTAMSMIFGNEANKKLGFIVEVFSTNEAAIKWLSK
jgi:hypothetical protein